MRRLAIVSIAALSACSRPLPAPAALAAEPTTTPEAPASSPGHPAACVEPRAADLLDPCSVTPEAPASGAAAAHALDEAERAYAAGEWAACFEAFDQAAASLPDRAQRVEAAYAAVLCITNEAEARDGEGRVRGWPGPREERLAPRELTERERATDRAYARYLCLAPEGDEAPAVQYRRARLYYGANQWGRAAVLFRDLVAREPGHELAPFAANLYLDCLNLIGRVEPARRSSCRGVMEEEVLGFLELAPLMRDEEVAGVLRSLWCGIRWARASDLLEAGRALEAAESFMGLHEDQRAGCVGSEHGMDEVLYNAAVAYSAAGRPAEAEAARRLLAAEHPASPFVQRAGPTEAPAPSEGGE